jgi:hypothetical protein
MVRTKVPMGLTDGLKVRRFLVGEPNEAELSLGFGAREATRELE